MTSKQTAGLSSPSILILSPQGGSFGSLLVYDRDLTTIYPKEKSHNKCVGTLISNDPWIKDTFDVKGTFSEKKAARGGVRETVYDYRKRSYKNVSVLMKTVND